jgi:hypothetical protein
LLAHGESPSNALAGGFRLAFIVALSCVVVAIVVTAFIVRSPAVAFATKDVQPSEMIES